MAPPDRLTSPKCGRLSAGGVVSTPPKTSAASPRGKSEHLAGEAAEGAFRASIPFAVLEAVARAIWSHAKAQAEITTAVETVEFSEPANACGSYMGHSPTSKRRRTTCELRDQATCIFPLRGPSQPSQPSQDEHTCSSSEALAQARGALDLAVAEAGGGDARIAAEVFAKVRGMTVAAMSYWREVSLDLSKAASCLHRFLDYQRPLYWRHAPWRGVNLGGWLLLEPGPSSTLFQQFDCAGCESQLMRKMRDTVGPEKAVEVLRAHRETFLVEDDFRRIRLLGMNAVRIPFGYWVVTGPAPDDDFVGPCLEYLDRALAWCKTFGLQVLLDLHGAPGGESGEKPCGRERKDWRWQDWRFDESIAALRAVATRYRGCECVTGIAVCNEPSETVPAEVLCSFYDRAVRTIREAGMPPDEVGIVLPVYRTERLDEIWRIWNRKFDGFAQHTNVAFDLHLYHCFGPWWQRQGLGSHLRMTKRHRKILRRVPAVVGEWSLALPPHAREEADDEEGALRTFAAAQLEAYGQASHGWFFWNWRDCPRQHPGWDAQQCFDRQWLSQPQVVANGGVISTPASVGLSGGGIARS